MTDSEAGAGAGQTTVREALEFSASLRLASDVSRDERQVGSLLFRRDPFVKPCRSSSSAGIPSARRFPPHSVHSVCSTIVSGIPRVHVEGSLGCMWRDLLGACGGIPVCGGPTGVPVSHGCPCVRGRARLSLCTHTCACVLGARLRVCDHVTVLMHWSTIIKALEGRKELHPIAAPEAGMQRVSSRGPANVFHFCACSLITFIFIFSGSVIIISCDFGPSCERSTCTRGS